MPRILVAPLDWGLGHTTRCVCIINALQAAGAQVIVACNAQQQAFLEKEIINVSYVFLSGYDVVYAKNSWFANVKIALQIPKMQRKIKMEHQWLQKIIATHNIDAVVSDNRYGLYAKNIESVIITHQLFIKAAFGEKIIEKWNWRNLNKFNACWVVDAADAKNNLSGSLSHGKNEVKNLKYIGPLSRFKNELNAQKLEEPKEQILIILSGPEPQKSILLEKILQRVGDTDLQIFVAGNAHKEIANNKVHYLGNVNTVALQNWIQQSKYIISRSGYTTIMDLAKINKRALLVPTPGQTEQLYLAKYVQQNKWHSTQLQHQLNVAAYLKTLSNWEPTDLKIDFQQHVSIIKDWVNTLALK